MRRLFSIWEIERPGHNRAIQSGVQVQQGDFVGIPFNRFGKKQPSVLSCLPFLLLLTGCGEPTGPDCGSPDARNSVVRSIADNKNNPLLNFAVQNADAVVEMASHANSETEKSAIFGKAKQDAVYSLEDTVVSNSRKPGLATCTALMHVRIGDTDVEKEVEFKVEQAVDGKISVSVTPFQF